MLEQPYCYNPEDNLIVGARKIATYIKSRGMGAFMRLVNDYHFPVGHLPDGQMFTTMRSIDEWLFMVAATVGENKRMEQYHPARERMLAAKRAAHERNGITPKRAAYIAELERRHGKKEAQEEKN